MAAPTAQSDETRTGGSSASQPVTPASLTRKEWMDVASFIFTGVAAVGLLVVVFGVFLTPNDVALLVGASIITLAAAGWLVSAVTLIVGIIKQWLTLMRTQFVIARSDSGVAIWLIPGATIPLGDEIATLRSQ